MTELRELKPLTSLQAGADVSVWQLTLLGAAAVAKRELRAQMASGALALPGYDESLVDLLIDVAAAARAPVEETWLAPTFLSATASAPDHQMRLDEIASRVRMSPGTVVRTWIWMIGAPRGTAPAALEPPVATKEALGGSPTGRAAASAIATAEAPLAKPLPRWGALLTPESRRVWMPAALGALVGAAFGLSTNIERARYSPVFPPELRALSANPTPDTAPVSPVDQPPVLAPLADSPLPAEPGP